MPALSVLCVLRRREKVVCFNAQCVMPNELEGRSLVWEVPSTLSAECLKTRFKVWV